MPKSYALQTTTGSGMRTLYNFLSNYSVEDFKLFLDYLNNPDTSNLAYIANKLGVTPSRVSQWIQHFFEVQYRPKAEMEEYLRIWIDIKRRGINELEQETNKPHEPFKLIVGGRSKKTSDRA